MLIVNGLGAAERGAADWLPTPAEPLNCAIGRERLVIFKADRSGAFVGCQLCPGLERHAHPVPAGDRLYLRAGTALWCLGDGE